MKEGNGRNTKEIIKWFEGKKKKTGQCYAGVFSPKKPFIPGTHDH